MNTWKPLKTQRIPACFIPNRRWPAYLPMPMEKLPICVKYILPNFSLLGQRLSNPLCQNVAQRKVQYDKRDRQSTGTRFQPRHPSRGANAARREGRIARAGWWFAQMRDIVERAMDGSHRRAASGTNLDSRRQPRSEGVTEKRKTGLLECWNGLGAELHNPITPLLHHSISE